MLRKLKETASRAIENYDTARMIISRAITWRKHRDGNFFQCLKASYDLHVIHQFEMYKD